MRGRTPVLIYDGDCGFCRRFVERWRRSTGRRVKYLPYQRPTVRWRHRVRKRDARKAAQLVDRDGRRYAGAAAVLRALLHARAPWIRMLARLGLLPGARLLAEVVYRTIAAHRQAASRAERRLARLLTARASG